MSRFFQACKGHDKCVNDGNFCRTCLRPNSEIEAARVIVENVTSFLIHQDYENTDEFFAFLKKRVLKKISHRQEK